MMTPDLGYTASMGPALRAAVEQQLLADLLPYGVDARGGRIDWSDTCPEGHRATWLDGALENWSGVNVYDTHGVAVAEGWMDFLDDPTGQQVVVFWETVVVWRDGAWREAKPPGIPAHVWARVAPSMRDMYVAGYWADDPLVRAWGQMRRQSGTDAGGIVGLDHEEVDHTGT